MAALTEADRMSMQVTWERAPGVVAPELAATWCGLEIEVDGRPATLVADRRGGGLRRGVHTSAYPLAEWIATRWWSLTQHVRPSARSVSGWTWARAGHEAWLSQHNLRAAGDGMPWPDLTLVPEGDVTRIVWRAGAGMAQQPLIFLTSGDVYLPAAAVHKALNGFVVQVLDRLEESGIRGTHLQEEWHALSLLDSEEREFAAAAARLGLDAFDLDKDVAEALESLSGTLNEALFEEFLDSADPTRLAAARRWLDRASRRVAPGGVPRADLPVAAADGLRPATDLRPWSRGYELAGSCRVHLDLSPTQRIDLNGVVKVTRVGGEAAGLQGLMRVIDDRVGLALPQELTGTAATRFAQARALGLSLLTGRDAALLDPTGTETAKTSRAFAAELLAPAAGVAEYLAVLADVTDRALEAIADRFGASPLLVQRQYDNQLG